MNLRNIKFIYFYNNKQKLFSRNEAIWITCVCINKKRELFEKTKKNINKVAKLNFRQAMTNFFLEKIIIFACYLFYGIKTLNAQMSVGLFTSTINSVLQLEQATARLFSGVISLKNDSLYYKDYESFINRVPSKRNGRNVETIRNIELKELSYRYINGKETVLRNLNLKLNPGMKICILGENGSGKTTLASIIAGNIESYKGKILLNNEDLKQFSASDFSTAVDVCPQEYIKYPYSLLFNIIFSSNYEKKLDSILQKSLVTEFVDKLPEKINSSLDARYNGGSDLSEGEWQRVLMARILYSDKDVIIFDEPTASLDPIAEEKIFDTIFSLKEKIVVVVSHRISCAKQADKIIVMSKGRFCEEGTHADLLQHKGLYYNMFKTQRKYYEVGNEQKRSECNSVK